MTYNEKDIFNLLQDYYFAESFTEYDVDTLVMTIEEKYDNIWYKFGATKCVIGSDTWDYVIKIPFTGCGEDDFEFEYANNRNVEELGNLYLDGWDYCAIEEAVYQIAKELDLDKCFAETVFIGFSKGHPIYVQEKCVVGNIKKHTDKEKERYLKKTNKMQTLSIATDWLIELFNHCGEQLFNDITYFLQDMININDLHNGNVGFKYDGSPVLVDYSGYED